MTHLIPFRTNDYISLCGKDCAKFTADCGATRCYYITRNTKIEYMPNSVCKVCYDRLFLWELTETDL